MKFSIKEYKIYCLVVAVWCIYLLLFSTISAPVQKLMPGVWSCPYRALTEKKCPFCGLNSEFNRLLNCNWDEPAVHPAGKIIFGLLTAEFFARIILLLAFFNSLFRKRFYSHSKQIFLFDILLHVSGGLVLLGLMVYCY